jgi:Flp pilus assembly protein TadG
MTPRRIRSRVVRDGLSEQGGYVAVMTALLLTVLMSLAAFAVDVGHWYLVGQQEQRAADAAAMAGVTSLPSDLNGATGATATAKKFAKSNGFEHLPSATNPTTVTAVLDGSSTRLRVTVTRTVDNIFGSLLRVPKTTISRTAVSDYAGPVPMGSPCNEFGSDPDPASNRAATCSGVTGVLWGSVAGPSDQKQQGDAYQAKNCGASYPADLCPTGGVNSEYDEKGYFYKVSVTAAMSSLTIQLFDPVFVGVDVLCNDSSFGSGGTASTAAVNDVVTDPTTRYASGTSSAYCTGDMLYQGTQVMNTQFTVRSPSITPWDPLSFQLLDPTNCQKTYPGHSGSLFNVLDQYTSGTTPRPTYNATIANGFRRWTTLCTISPPAGSTSVPLGDYLIQVKTNGLSSALNTAQAGNRFSIRAYGAVSGDKENISVAGRERMSVFSNKPSNLVDYHLARVPSAAAGQTLKVRLFDVGDSNTSGTIYVLKPADAAGPAFTNCTGIRGSAAAVTLANCSLPVSMSTHQGKWQTISVPIPATYSCADSDNTKCWVKLKYDYGGGSNPYDIATWTASVEGDPVRLVE